MSDIKRVKPGIPTGGEFAKHDRAESAIGLGIKDLSITVDIVWTELELPSPRHRNLVPVEHFGTETSVLRVVDAEDAPEAFEYVRYDDDPLTIRVIDGELYAQRFAGRFGSAAEPITADVNWMAEMLTPERWYTPDSERTARENITKCLSEFVSIDGSLWCKIDGEPQYEVMTFGLGGNHGGTTLNTTISRNGNVREESYFLADEYDEAVAYATATALDRGDNESVARIQAMKPIIVHDKSLIGSNATRVTRLNLPRAYQVTTETYPSMKEAYIAEIGRIPGAIVTDETGRRRVDFDKLTEHQGYETKSLLKFGAEQGLL